MSNIIMQALVQCYDIRGCVVVVLFIEYPPPIKVMLADDAVSHYGPISSNLVNERLSCAFCVRLTAQAIWGPNIWLTGQKFHCHLLEDMNHGSLLRQVW